ncbi:MAG: STAS domain-containing protein [Rhodocyclaceae bacterium]|nr:STAS domain-containing protein [Rhodocyclaceae bacterium]
MSVSSEREQSALAIAGSMTLERAPALLAEGNAALAAGRELFDLSGVSEVDSSGLAVLFAWQRTARASGKNLRIAHPPEGLIKLAHVYGVAELLPLA